MDCLVEFGLGCPLSCPTVYVWMAWTSQFEFEPLSLSLMQIYGRARESFEE